ncbi:MAG: alanine racemase [Acidimicrobiales bacterium]
MTDSYRPTWAEIDTSAVTANVALLCRLVAPARLCAVVKADGYGHGSVAVARAALSGGAAMLAVALVEEAVTLREAGIDAPVLLLTEAPPDGIGEFLAIGGMPTVYSEPGIALAAGAAARLGRQVGVHLKVDTGMHRVGADSADVPALAASVAGSGPLSLGGLWTHFAVADDLDDAFTATQIDRFDSAVAAVRAAGGSPAVLHAANSAGAIAHPRGRYDLVRCGIACYGYAPSVQVGRVLAGLVGPGEALRPALSLKARVHRVHRLAAGERTSYGRNYELAADTLVATVPIGYADGLRRALAAAGGEVLVGGRRRRIAGTVTMDQLLVDCGDDDVRAGDEVVLIGRQGGEEITADEWAERLGTIVYEVLCGIGPRVPRRVI